MKRILVKIDKELARELRNRAARDGNPTLASGWAKSALDGGKVESVLSDENYSRLQKRLKKLNLTLDQYIDAVMRADLER